MIYNYKNETNKNESRIPTPLADRSSVKKFALVDLSHGIYFSNFSWMWYDIESPKFEVFSSNWNFL